MLMFKKSEIDKWLLRTRVKDNTEIMDEAQRYVATHPLGGRRRSPVWSRSMWP